MLSIFKHLKPISTRLIVCLTPGKKIARRIFSPKSKKSGGTPPLGSAAFFSPSGATGVKFFGKSPRKKIAFLNWKLGKGFKGRKCGAGLRAENKRLKEQLINLAEVAKRFICIADSMLRAEDTSETALVLKESLVSLEYAIKLAENKAWRSTDE